jgi:predicted esterase
MPVRQAVVRVRGGLQEVGWLVYQGLVLIAAMGFGVRWLWMLARTVTFGLLIFAGLLKVIWFYLTSPYVLKRVRYSDELVKITPISLTSVMPAGRNTTHANSPLPPTPTKSKPVGAFERLRRAMSLRYGHIHDPKMSAGPPAGGAKKRDSPRSSHGRKSKSSASGGTPQSATDESECVSLSTATPLTPVDASAEGFAPPQQSASVSSSSSSEGSSDLDDPVAAHEGARRVASGIRNRFVGSSINPTGGVGSAESDSGPATREHHPIVDAITDSDLDGMGLNNRAFLDIHFPVPVDSFLGSTGPTLAAAMPCEPEDVTQEKQVTREAIERALKREQAHNAHLKEKEHRAHHDHQHQNARHRSASASVGSGPRSTSTRGAGTASPHRLPVHCDFKKHASKHVGVRHAREIYVPPTIVEPSTTGKPGDARVAFPVIILVTGGAWIIGSHFWMVMMARVFSACGFIAVTPDYRNFPSALIPDMVDDVDAAIEWTVKNIARFHGDPNRIYLLGQSAGAHLCTLSMLRQTAALYDAVAESTASPAFPSGASGRGGGGGEGTPVGKLDLSDAVSVSSSVGLDATLGGVPAWRYHPRKNIRAFIGLSGMYDLHGMADYLHSRGLYRGVLKRLCAHDVAGCSALVQLQQADSMALAKYFPRLVVFAHGNCDESAPLSESAHMTAVLRSKLAEVTAEASIKYGANFASGNRLTPVVRLHTLAGATHTTPMVEDFLSGKSEIAAIILAIARQDYEETLKAKQQQSAGTSSANSPFTKAKGANGNGTTQSGVNGGGIAHWEPISAENTPRKGSGLPPRAPATAGAPRPLGNIALPHRDESAMIPSLRGPGTGMTPLTSVSPQRGMTPVQGQQGATPPAPADRATLEASFVGGAGTVSFSARTVAAVQAALMNESSGFLGDSPMKGAREDQGAHKHHHSQKAHPPVVKFRALMWPWLADLASFVSAF